MTKDDVLVDGLRCAPGTPFFRWLTARLRETLGVRYAFIAEFTGDDARRLRLLATSEDTDAAHHEGNEYDIDGTPAAGAPDGEGLLWYPEGLRARFPHVRLVQALGLDSFAAVRLIDARGRALGLLGVVGTGPFAAPAGLRRTLLRLRARVAGDLELRREQRDRDAGREILAGGVAHDFNNLLAGIMAHSGLALDELAAPDAVRARLEAIRLTAQRAADLARGLLDAGTERPADESVDLGALARETVTLLAPSIPPHVQIAFDEEPDLPAVRGNASQLRQIVMNLLLNAVEAVGDRAGRVIVRLEQPESGRRGGVALAISDTGIGMNAETQARIFEPSFTTKARGRGIGLPLVRELAVRHRARLAVESTPGVGSRFTVTFERTVARLRPVAPVGPPAEPGGGRRRALLVDDDEGVRLTTAHMLRRLGCDVVTAADGAAALAALDVGAGGLDLVFVDMAMPGMSGEDLLAAIRDRWPALPIVVISGYASHDLARRLGQKGALRFLQKPFGLDALRRCLHELEPAPVPAGARRRAAVSA